MDRWRENTWCIRSGIQGNRRNQLHGGRGENHSALLILGGSERFHLPSVVLTSHSFIFQIRGSWQGRGYALPQKHSKRERGKSDNSPKKVIWFALFFSLMHCLLLSVYTFVKRYRLVLLRKASIVWSIKWLVADWFMCALSPVKV